MPVPHVLLEREMRNAAVLAREVMVTDCGTACKREDCLKECKSRQILDAVKDYQIKLSRIMLDY